MPPAPSDRPVPLARTISASTQVQGGDINLYENMRCHGVPLVTISRGRVVYENGVFMCAEGTGKFCPLRSFPDIAYKKLVQREKVPGAGGSAVLWDRAGCWRGRGQWPCQTRVCARLMWQERRAGDGGTQCVTEDPPWVLASTLAVREDSCPNTCVTISRRVLSIKAPHAPIQALPFAGCPKAQLTVAPDALGQAPGWLGLPSGDTLAVPVTVSPRCGCRDRPG